MAYRNTLETSLVEWKRSLRRLTDGPGPLLGNFLSGMETGRTVRPRRSHGRLGNFLSGMETPEDLWDQRYPFSPLETSLVEWKHRRRRDVPRPNFPWKLP